MTRTGTTSCNRWHWARTGITTVTRRCSTGPWRLNRPTTIIISPARPPSCRAGAAGRIPGSTSPRRAARKYDPKEGLSIYARIYWSHAGSVGGGGFQNPKLDWKKVRQGFRDIETQYPDSNWNLNNFCRFACLAGDHETARELFGRVGDAVSLPTWGSRTAFEGWRKWSEPGQDAALLRADLVVPTDESLMIQSVVFLAGRQDAAGRLRGRICPALGPGHEENRLERGCRARAGHRRRVLARWQAARRRDGQSLQGGHAGYRCPVGHRDAGRNW